MPSGPQGFFGRLRPPRTMNQDTTHRMVKRQRPSLQGRAAKPMRAADRVSSQVPLMLRGFPLWGAVSFQYDRGCYSARHLASKEDRDIGRLDA